MAVGRVAGRTSPVPAARRRPGGGSRTGGASRTGGRAAGRGPFAVLVVLILAGGLIALLMLNTALNQGSFQLSQLQQRTTSLTDERQGLQQQIGAWSAPDALAARAQQLGMVPGGTPAFLRDNGTVQGVPTPLSGPPVHAAPTPAATATPTAASSTTPTPTTTTTATGTATTVANTTAHANTTANARGTTATAGTKPHAATRPAAAATARPATARPAARPAAGTPSTAARGH